MAIQFVEVVFCGPHQKHVKIITADGTVIGQFALLGCAGRFDDDKLALGIKKLYDAYLKSYVG